MTTTIQRTPFSWKAILPKKIDLDAMAKPIHDAILDSAKEMEKDLNAVTRTWKSDKPTIVHGVKQVSFLGFFSKFTASAWPKNDNSKGYWKWIWLDLGTRVRYAVMSNPFIPKTRAGQLQSWAGKGKMLFVSKKHPMPGIKARKFSKALKDKWARPTMFKARMQAAVSKARKASGHAI